MREGGPAGAARSPAPAPEGCDQGSSCAVREGATVAGEILVVAFGWGTVVTNRSYNVTMEMDILAEEEEKLPGG